jgi:ankyrin repeat protein
MLKFTSLLALMTSQKHIPILRILGGVNYCEITTALHDLMETNFDLSEIYEFSQNPQSNIHEAIQLRGSNFRPKSSRTINLRWKNTKFFNSFIKTVPVDHKDVAKLPPNPNAVPPSINHGVITAEQFDQFTQKFFPGLFVSPLDKSYVFDRECQSCGVLSPNYTLTPSIENLSVSPKKNVVLQKWFQEAFIAMGCLNLFMIPDENIVYNDTKQFQFFECDSLLKPTTYLIHEKDKIVETDKVTVIPPSDLIQGLITDTEFSPSQRDQIIAQVKHILDLINDDTAPYNQFTNDLKRQKKKILEAISKGLSENRFNNWQDLYLVFNPWHKIALAADFFTNPLSSSNRNFFTPIDLITPLAILHERGYLLDQLFGHCVHPDVNFTTINLSLFRSKFSIHELMSNREYIKTVINHIPITKSSRIIDGTLHQFNPGSSILHEINVQIIEKELLHRTFLDFNDVINKMDLALALHSALMNGRSLVVRQLLDMLNPTQVFYDIKDNILHIAVSQISPDNLLGHLETLKMVLQKWNDAKMPIDKINRRGQTPLHYAINTGCLKAVQILLDEGADVLTKDCYGMAALDHVFHHPEIEALIKSKIEGLAANSSSSRD